MIWFSVVSGRLNGCLGLYLLAWTIILSFACVAESSKFLVRFASSISRFKFILLTKCSLKYQKSSTSFILDGWKFHLKSTVENLPIFIDTNNYHASKDQHWQNNDFCRVFAWIIFMYRKHRLLDHSLIKKIQSCNGFDFQLTWSIVMFMQFMRF